MAKASKAMKKAEGHAPVTASVDRMRAEERKYKAEDAMRTLMRAEEHKKDKGLMKDVQKMASDQAKKMQGLCGKGK